MNQADPSSIDLTSCAWRLLADPEEVGVANQWFAEVNRITKHPNAIDGRIGKAWQRSFGADFTGNIVWHKARLQVPIDWNFKRTTICFDSVANHCTVWINGKQVGDHVGDYVPFQFDISKFVKAGADLEIVLRVELIRDHIAKGFHDVLSIMHGGIWQGVCIRGSGELMLRPNGLQINANAETGEVSLECEFSKIQPNRGGSIEVTIRNGTKEICASATERIQAGSKRALFYLNVAKESMRLWSTHEPNLFRLELSLRNASGTISERINRSFGFRTITIHNEQIILNGSAVFLRGILHWGHEPKHLAPAVPIDELHDQMLRLKEMGFNCICLCMWYPPDYFFDLADELRKYLLHRLIESAIRSDRNQTRDTRSKRVSLALIRDELNG